MKIKTFTTEYTEDAESFRKAEKRIHHKGHKEHEGTGKKTSLFFVTFVSFVVQFFVVLFVAPSGSRRI